MVLKFHQEPIQIRPLPHISHPNSLFEISLNMRYIITPEQNNRGHCRIRAAMPEERLARLQKIKSVENVCNW